MYECSTCIYFDLWEGYCIRTGEIKDWDDGCMRWKEETGETGRE